MGYVINTKAIGELMTQLKSSDEGTMIRALDAIRSIPHDETRVELLEHAARHLGSPRLATEAFEELCEGLEALGFTAWERASQLRDILEYGSKVSAIRLLSMQYVVELVEQGKLERKREDVQRVLKFIVEIVVDKESEVVRKARALLVRNL